MKIGSLKESFRDFVKDIEKVDRLNQKEAIENFFEDHSIDIDEISKEDLYDFRIWVYYHYNSLPTAEELEYTHFEKLTEKIVEWLETNSWFCWLNETDNRGVLICEDYEIKQFVDIRNHLRGMMEKYIILPHQNFNLHSRYDDSLKAFIENNKLENEDEISEEDKDQIRENIFKFYIHEENQWIHKLIQDTFGLKEFQHQ